MIIQELLERIVHVQFPTQKELGMTFLRFQEHYESPKFKGRVFTLEEYQRWYLEESNTGRETGKFSYYEDWAGFNVPSTILKPFYEGRFDPLSVQEDRLLAALESRHRQRIDFYLIGTSEESDDDTLKHEIAHGLFYIHPEYRARVKRLIKRIPKRETEFFRRVLTNQAGGYHPDVFEDEVQAYLIAELDYLKGGGMRLKTIKEVLKELHANFNQFSKGLFE